MFRNIGEYLALCELNAIELSSNEIGNIGKGALVKGIKTCEYSAGTAEFREGYVQTKSADNTPHKKTLRTKSI